MQLSQRVFLQSTLPVWTRSALPPSPILSFASCAECCIVQCKADVLLQRCLTTAGNGGRAKGEWSEFLGLIWLQGRLLRMISACMSPTCAFADILPDALTVGAMLCTVQLK